jgi:hypothetical protein
MTDVSTGSTDEDDKDPPVTADPSDPAGIKAWSLKTAGTIIGLIGLSGSMVLIGSGVLWVRFREAGVPPIQAVSVQSHDEALAQGAQMTIFFVLIALAVVAALYVFDGIDISSEAKKKQADPHPIGTLTRRGVYVLPILGIAWAFIWPDLTFVQAGALGVLAIVMAAGCLWIGRDGSKNFWALAAAVFVAVIVFSGAAKYVIVKEQKYIQAVAVLGKEEPGVSGFYVAANGESLYVATAVGPRAGRTGDKAIQKFTLGEGVSYLVGPLESIPDAEKTSKALLEQLEGERKGDTSDLSAQSPPSWATDEVLATFGGEVEPHEEVSGKPLCLMRYAGRAQTEVRKPFWTSCAEAEALATIQDARQRLALPIRFQGDYVNRVKVEVPVGEKVRYLEGTVAPQCGGGAAEPCGNRYPGGGLQYWLDEPEAHLSPASLSFECTSSNADQQSVWKPERCTDEGPG